MRTLAAPIGLLLVAMFSIQFGASLAKTLFPVLGPEGTSVARLAFASLILLVAWRPWRQRLARRDVAAVAAYGLALGGMNYLFYLAIARIPLGLAVAIEFTGPLAVAVLASRRRADFLWIVLAALGILLVLPITPASSALDLRGVLLALAAGGCWALYIVAGKRLGARLPGGTAASLGMLAAALAVLPVGLVQSGARLWNPSALPAALAMALLSSAVPYSLEMFALKRIPAKTFGVLMSLEPAIGALSGFLFLHESLTPVQWLAIGLVIAASAGTAMTSQGAAPEPA